jgi:uncharacterized membrane protein YozB (DUF420 family)
MDPSVLPPINAGLNATAAVLLACGYATIRKGRVEAHWRLMLAAFVVSVLFLACYLTYHVWRQQTTGSAHTTFPRVGVARTIYLGVLATHLTLAIPVVPMSVTTLLRGWRGRLDAHVKLARWTLPVWLYVSVTGVAVYGMLYYLAPWLSGKG